MLMAKQDLQEFVGHALDSVDETSQDEVRQNIVAKAQKLGITVATNKIAMVYENTDTRLAAQRIVCHKIPVQFQNKRVGISFRYVETVAGCQTDQQIHAAKIRQISVPVPPSAAVQELLDSP